MGISLASFRRIEQLQEDVAKRDLNGVLCMAPENILALTGCWPSYGPSAVLLPVEGTAFLVTGETEEKFIPDGFSGEVVFYDFEEGPSPFHRLLIEAIKERNLEKGSLGLELSMRTIAASHVGGEMFIPTASEVSPIAEEFSELTWRDATDLIFAARKVKSQDEIERISLVAQVANQVLASVEKEVEAGITEVEVAGLLEARFQTRGIATGSLSRARAFAFVMSGPRSGAIDSWGPYNFSTSRIIRTGDPVIIEFDAYIDGYWVDLTRTWVFGERSAQQERVLQGLEDVVSAVRPLLKPGVEIGEVDRRFREEMHSRGLLSRCPHGLGHGVGFAFHEPPFLVAGSDERLEKGMVLAVEPGAYFGDSGGFRLEDEYVVAPGGGVPIRLEYRGPEPGRR